MAGSQHLKWRPRNGNESNNLIFIERNVNIEMACFNLSWHRNTAEMLTVLGKFEYQTPTHTSIFLAVSMKLQKYTHLDIQQTKLPASSVSCLNLRCFLSNIWHHHDKHRTTPVKLVDPSNHQSLCQTSLCLINFFQEIGPHRTHERTDPEKT